ncbi:MAG: methyltransferase domain-containing protein [Planctomycetota bacterium]
MTTPRVSILIPNYNNGRQSSRDGQTDLIGDLLASLRKTLADDPTPLEIIATDDGSTDDSLETLRREAATPWQSGWRAGRPMMRLLEREHCGVLSVIANELVRESSGDILVRLDGDVVINTPRFAQKLVAAFERLPERVGVIGPKQVLPSGKVHSFGDWVLHPKGYHHIGQGLPGTAVVKAVECDHVMGCFYCCKRAVYDRVGGFDETFLRGQTVDFGLEARRLGYACFAIPEVEFVHRHMLREDRSTRADTADGIDQSRQTFIDKWGFDRIAADLDVVRERYAGTGLCWNANVFGGPRGYAETSASALPTSMEQTEWARFGKEPALKAAVELRAKIAIEAALRYVPGGGQAADAGPIVMLGCGSGLVAHLIGLRGIEAIGVDRCVPHIDLAERLVAGHEYPGARPRFEKMTDRRKSPLPDGCASVVLLADRLEHHDNPVGVLTEAKRLLKPGGVVAVVSMRHPGVLLDPLHPQHPYQPHELKAQVRAVLQMGVVSEETPDPLGTTRPMVVLALPLGHPALGAEAPAAEQSGQAQPIAA